jgi:hypothetical protein
LCIYFESVRNWDLQTGLVAQHPSRSFARDVRTWALVVSPVPRTPVEKVKAAPVNSPTV